MSAQIVIFNALGLLPADIEREIRHGVEEGIDTFGRHAKVENVGVAVHPHGCVSEFTGLGGMNYGPESFAVFADAAYEGLRMDTRRRAAAVTAHELHHALRTRHYLPKLLYNSLDLCAGEILAMEGLAIHCEYFLGFGPSLNISDVSPETARALIKRIAPIIDEPKANWYWIYELNDLPAPVYKAMYPMGFHIVAEYLRKHDVSPIDALYVPWQDFWEAFKASTSEMSWVSSTSENS
jgi:hypothetical protein